MKRGKNMKSEQAIDIVEELGDRIPKGQKTIFKALVDDSKKMEQRMTALERTVSEVKTEVKSVKSEVRDVKNTLNNLSDKIDTVINEKQSLWKFLGMLIKETRFWVWLIVLTLLIFGVTEADLFNFLKIQ